MMTSFRLDQIRRKRLEQLDVADIADLVSEVDAVLRWQHNERLRNREFGHAIVVDAIGHYHEVNLMSHGWDGTSAFFPLSLKFPLKFRESYRPLEEAMTTTAGVFSCRVFSLREVDNVSGKPIYTEVTP